MEQTTLGQSGTTGFGFFDVPGSLLDPNLVTVLEARISVHEVSGSVGNAGVFFQAFDGLHRYSVFFASDGIYIPTLTGFDHLAVDISGFHTYRLESTGASGQARFYYDGTLIDTASVALSALNGFNFGDGESEPGGNATWDYVRFSQIGVESPCLPSPAGLIAWWRGENNALDSAGNDHGSVDGAVTYAAGKCGTAFQFDGSASGVNLGDSSALDFGPNSSFTIEAWFERFGPNASGNDGEIIIALNYNCGNTVQAIGLNRATGQLGFSVRDADGVLTTVSTAAAV